LAHVDIRVTGIPRVWGEPYCFTDIVVRMAERVVEWTLAARWEPNAPDAVVVSNDRGLSALALEPHTDDADRRCVVLIWTGTKLARMSDPNDEAREGHRLWSRGLASIHWAALVEASELVAELETANRVHPSHDPAKFRRLSHYVLPLKECTVEVVARDAQLLRYEGPPLSAAGRAMVPQT
jgi:hypothetical protein